MSDDSSLQILLDFDAWATRQIILACEKLTPEQFSAPFNMGPGSLQKTITHILGAIKTWTQTLAQMEIALRLEEDPIARSAGQFLELLDPVYRDFQKELDRLPLEATATRKLKRGRVIALPRRDLFLHVTTHGMHHRAQCLNMLRQLGVAPLPPSSVVEWRMMRP